MTGTMIKYAVSEVLTVYNWDTHYMLQIKGSIPAARMIKAVPQDDLT